MRYQSIGTCDIVDKMFNQLTQDSIFCAYNFAEDCQIGSYLIGDGTCEFCPVDTYQNETRQDTCLPCDAGFGTRNNGSYAWADCESMEISIASSSRLKMI